MTQLQQIQEIAALQAQLEKGVSGGEGIELYDRLRNLCNELDFDELAEEVRELRASASVFMRHATRPGDDGRFDDAYDAAKSKLQQLLEDPDV